MSGTTGPSELVPAAGVSPEQLAARVPPALRRDLEVARQRYQEQTFAVIKDPVSLRYLRIPWQDYELAKTFDGVKSQGVLAAEWAERFPELRVEYGAEGLVHKADALRRDVFGQHLCEIGGEASVSLRGHQREVRRKARRYSWLTSWFVLRKSVYDPDALLTALHGRLRFLFTPQVFRWSLVLIALSAVLFVVNFKEAGIDPGWFFSLPNLVLLYVSFFVLKVVHEFAHGLSCKHYGGEVQEIGFMFVAFQPLFYVNVTDAWMFPEKRKRIAVMAAGMYVEMVLAALLVLVWLPLAPGFAKNLAMNLLLVASIATVAFNANPLMRFDGYYILCDLLEIPNLQVRSRRYFGERWRTFLFGAPPEEAAGDVLPKRHRRIFAWYAVLSSAYLLLIIYSMLRLLDHFLDKFGLSFIGHLLAGMALTGMLVLPIGMFLTRGFRDAAARGGHALRTPLVRLGLAALLIVGILALPWRQSVRRSCAIELATAEVIRPAVSGFVRSVAVGEGARLAPGAVVAQLENRELANRVRSLAIEREWLAVARDAAVAEGAASSVRDYSDRLAQVEIGLAEARRQESELTLKTAQGGVVLTRKLADRVGHGLKAGDVFALVMDPEAVEILVPLEEKQARLIRVGARAEVRVRAFPGTDLPAVVVQAPLKSIDRALPAALAAQRGGDVATTIDKTGEELLLETVYYARLRVEGGAGNLRPGMTGLVRIEGEWKTVGGILRQWFLDAVRVDYRL